MVMSRLGPHVYRHWRNADTRSRVILFDQPDLSLMRNVMVSSLLLLFSAHLFADTSLVEHQLKVRIDPAAGALTVEDTLTLPDDRAEWTVLLHAGMDPTVTSGNADIVEAGQLEHLARYRLRIAGPGPVILTYGGAIRHERERIAEGMGRAREWSRGTISPEGVFLDGNSGWYPRIPDTLQSFSLEVALPPGWTAVSQGAGPGEPTSGVSTWTETHPQDDLYLIAGPFETYRAQAAGFEAQVYLRRPDADLAQRYLDATATYVDLYSDLIGAYPFAKFALIENFWETGYGMPSFTLLGPQVIRLPFIIHTSYPHEILHNWWGNGVYVDYPSGNWSEGLTTYLADHLLRERAGEGWVYRRDTLKSYSDYVRDSSDFPLLQFRGRHGAASQAIGYGKSAMFFHMLRRQLGDETFKAGLQRFYADNRFRVAGFRDLRRAFEAVADRDLGGFFETWTERTGAPRLRLTDVAVSTKDQGFELGGRIEQTQEGATFPVLVPVLVHQEDGDPISIAVDLTESSKDFNLSLPSRADTRRRRPLVRCLPRASSGRDTGCTRQSFRLGARADPAAGCGTRGLQERLPAPRRGMAVGTPGLGRALGRCRQGPARGPRRVATGLGESLDRSICRAGAGCGAEAGPTPRSTPERRPDGRLGDHQPRPHGLARPTTARLACRRRPGSPAGSRAQASALRQIQLSDLRRNGTREPG
jgi:aminopeptidase N